MTDNTEPQRVPSNDTAAEADAPAIPQGESSREADPDLLLAERTTPELRRWLRARYRVVTGE